MSALPWFRYFPGSFFNDPHVRRMTDEEVGFYHRLLWLAWEEDLPGSLPESLEEIARISKQSIRKVRRMFDGLIGKCWVHKDGRIWNPKLVEEAQKQGVISARRARSARIRWDANAHANANANAPSLHLLSKSKEVIKKRKETKPPVSHSADAERIFKFWVEVFKKAPRTKFLGDRKRKVVSRFREGTTEKEIRMAIVGCSLSDFHRDNGHNDLELICRNRGQIEKFIEKVPLAEPGTEKAKTAIWEKGYFRTADGTFFQKGKKEAPH